jgi:hypothetical protein
MKSILKFFLSLITLNSLVFSLSAQTPDSIKIKAAYIYKALASGNVKQLTQLTTQDLPKQIHSYALRTIRTEEKDTDNISIFVSVDDSLKRLYISEQHSLPREAAVMHTFSFDLKGVLLYAGTDNGAMDIYDEIDFSKKNFDKMLYQKYLPHITKTLDDIYKKIR